MKNKFLDNLLKFAIGPMGAAVIGFITVPITTWLVAPEEFGQTTIFTLVQTLITSFIYLGIDQAYVREFHSYKGDKTNLFLNAIFIPAVITILLMALMLFNLQRVSLYLFEEVNILLTSSLIVWIPFTVMERFLLLNTRMEEKGLHYSVFNIGVKLLIMLLTVTLLLLQSRTYSSIILGSIWGQIIADICIIVYSRKQFQFKNFQFEKDLIWIMIKFGLPILPAVMISWILNSTDRIVLQQYSTLHDIGIYFAAMKFVAALTMIQTIFTTFWTPIAYRWHEEKQDTEQFTRVSYGVFIIMGIVFILMLIFKKILILILSPEYSEAQYILPFLLFTPIMYTVSETTMLGINFSRKTHLSIWVSLASAITNIIINIFLVPIIGAVGAAIGTGCAYIVFFITRTLISRKYWYKIKMKFYVINILVLLIIASLNIIVKSNSIYFINFLSLIGYLIVNISFIQFIFKRQVAILSATHEKTHK